MTREDALKILKDIQRKDLDEADFLGKCAIDMAIEALKEMPVEEYRQRLMEVFHRTDHDELLTYVVMPKEEEFKSLEDILRQFKFEPRPHGEWIDKDYGVGKCWATCSECGESTNGEAQDHGFGYDYSFPNFCPNCGALMISSNSEIEKSKSEIVPDYRDGWRLRGGEAE